MVDAAFSYERALIVCKFLQESFKVKESNLHEIWNADTMFLLSGAHIKNCTVKTISGYFASTVYNYMQNFEEFSFSN